SRRAAGLTRQARRTRRHTPTTDFWAAAVSFANPGDLRTLAEAAEDRGLLRDAARLRKHAAAQGDTTAACTLIQSWAFMHPADQSPARWVAAHAALNSPSAVAELLRTLRDVGADEQVSALLARDPATHAALDDASAVARLLGTLREAGADEQVTILAGRLAAHAELHNPSALAWLLGILRRAGADEQVTILAGRLAAHAELHNP